MGQSRLKLRVRVFRSSSKVQKVGVNVIEVCAGGEAVRERSEADNVVELLLTLWLLLLLCVLLSCKAHQLPWGGSKPFGHLLLCFPCPIELPL